MTDSSQESSECLPEFTRFVEKCEEVWVDQEELNLRLEKQMIDNGTSLEALRSNVSQLKVECERLNNSLKREKKSSMIVDDTTRALREAVKQARVHCKLQSSATSSFESNAAQMANYLERMESLVAEARGTFAERERAHLATTTQLSARASELIQQKERYYAQQGLLEAAVSTKVKKLSEQMKQVKQELALSKSKEATVAEEKRLLREENDQKASKLLQLKARLEEMRSAHLNHVRESNAYLQQRQDMSSEKKSQISALKETLHELEVVTEQTGRKRSELKEALALAEDEQNARDAELQEAEPKLREIAATNEILIEKEKEYSTKINNDVKVLDDIKKQIDTKHDDVKQQRERLTSMYWEKTHRQQRRASDMQARLTELSAVDLYAAELETLQRDVLGYRQQAKTALREDEEMGDIRYARIREVTESITACEEEIDKNIAIITEMKKKIEIDNNNSNSLSKQNDELCDAMKNIQDRLEEAKMQTLETTLRNKQRVEEEIKKHTDELNTVKKVLKKLEEIIAQQNKDYSTFVEERTAEEVELRAKIQEKEWKREELEARVEQLKDEASEHELYKKERDSLSEELSRKAAEYEEHIRSARKRLAGNDKEVERLVKEIKWSTDTRVKLGADNDSLKLQVDALHEQIAALHNVEKPQKEEQRGVTESSDPTAAAGSTTAAPQFRRPGAPVPRAPRRRSRLRAVASATTPAAAAPRTELDFDLSDMSN